MARADYEVVEVVADLVFLVDLDRGGRSVTNDAEAVVAEMLAMHPGRRVVYRDSRGRWDELCHDGRAFVGFAPWQGRTH